MELMVCEVEAAEIVISVQDEGVYLEKQKACLHQKEQKYIVVKAGRCAVVEWFIANSR